MSQLEEPFKLISTDTNVAATDNRIFNMAGSDDSKPNGMDGDKVDENNASTQNEENIREEYDQLDVKLDELNQALDFLEQKNDDIHQRLRELLQSNREIRKEMQNGKQESQ
ncbi:UPF0184 protein C9orf16 homolog isoform X1 [Zerene cesonia]|uniref:UPF0184 protein C9orf16 homolog isoform X1 n=1 Tax=Zerene cesonia TaxID=33412 RepID=UPI0018E4FCC6|nr:UPF0184 protein C9orf16 homolog isoform X1 [Zerene cesonia]